MTDNHSNGWSEYQKLVLAEIERHNSWLNAIDEKLNATLLTFKLQTQMVEHLAEMVNRLDKRVEALDDNHVAAEAVEEYRKAADANKKWIIGLSFSTIVAVVGMAVNTLTRIFAG